MKKVIALIDCNNFFVSCEQLFNPSLQGKAVCVLSANEGCIIARSNAAKKVGVAMGMPYFIAKRQFQNVIYLRANLGLYREMSERVMQKLAQYSSKVQVYSIDEAFLELSDVKKTHNLSYEELIKKIKTELKNEVGIDVSIGLSYSKTLAKLASNKAKLTANFGRENFQAGLYKIGFREIENELSKTPIEDVWGIGKNTTALLRKFFIRTALDFVNQNDAWIKRTMGKVGLDLKQELLGNPISPVDAGVAPPKSIQKTATFPSPTSDKNYIKNELNFHTHRVCRKLRKLGLLGEVLTVMLKTKDFNYYTQKTTFTIPTNSEFEVNKIAFDLLNEIFNPYLQYRSCGITISKLNSVNTLQLPLLGHNERLNAKNISAAWDKIEQKFGAGKLNIGVSIGVNIGVS